jgi:hypothetical protein
MMALLDLGLFLIDPTLWNEDRAQCTLPIEALLLHDPQLRRLPIRLLWSDEFLMGFPWSQPDCPVELRDICAVLWSLHEYLHANRRLILLDDVGIPSGNFTIEPKSLLEGFGEDAQLAWSWLFAWATHEARVDNGVAVPTWTKSSLSAVREVHVSSDELAFKTHGSAILLFGDADWQTFVLTYQRPDLRGKRVAILGGRRDSFERARKRLDAYGIDVRDVRRLPPAYEETRTKQETLERLRNVDLLIVCTNRCKHVDTDHLDSALSCARIDLNSDGDTALVDTVVRHFRNQ